MKNLIYAALALAVVACAPANNTNGASDTAAPTATASTTTNTTAAPTTGGAPAATPKAGEEERPMSYYENKIAELHTTSGEIDIRFYPDKAPGHVKNFIDLAEKGFYNGTKFHRVIPGFMIQGGDPLGQGVGGPGYNFEDEFQSGRVFDKPGILAMANRGPATNGSQFFITVAPTPWLNNHHTIFGETVKGYDVVEKISRVQTIGGSVPATPVVIKKVTISDKQP